MDEIWEEKKNNELGLALEKRGDEYILNGKDFMQKYLDKKESSIEERNYWWDWNRRNFRRESNRWD